MVVEVLRSSDSLRLSPITSNRCIQCLLLVFTVSTLIRAPIGNTNIGPAVAVAFVHRRGTITRDAICVYAVVAEEEGKRNEGDGDTVLHFVWIFRCQLF